MDYSTSVLGSHIANELRQRTTRGLLIIGSDTFSRKDLAGVSCYSFTAAASLSHILETVRISDGNRKITDTRDLYNNVPPEALLLPRLGSISLAVLGAAFEKKGLGGDTPLVNWIKKHHAKDVPIVTFSTMKHQDAERDGAAAERKAKKDRKHARRNEAHKKRVQRYESKTLNGGTVTS
jgi:hypothetical protein